MRDYKAMSQIAQAWEIESKGKEAELRSTREEHDRQVLKRRSELILAREEVDKLLQAKDHEVAEARERQSMAEVALSATREQLKAAKESALAAAAAGASYSKLRSLTRAAPRP